MWGAHWPTGWDRCRQDARFLVRYGVDAHRHHWRVHAHLLDWSQFDIYLCRDSGVVAGSWLSATLPRHVGAPALYVDAGFHHWLCPIGTAGADDPVDDAGRAVPRLHSHGAIQRPGGAVGPLPARPAQC